ncbi:MAG: hypothetical protein KA163_02350 [Bacteroidia bacterium]|nr:hypothetical protein [Bacteroidia bacterium]
MKKQYFILLLLLFIGLSNSYSQSEINLIGDNASIGATPYILNVKPIDSNKLLVKYVCVLPCIVKSKEETTLNGLAVINANGGLRSIGLSDVVMILVEQEVNIATKAINITNKNLIALRGLNESLTYTISLEGVSNEKKLLQEGAVVPYSKLNLSKIIGITGDEIVALEGVIKVYEGGTKGRDAGSIPFQMVAQKIYSNKKDLYDLLNEDKVKFENFSIPQDENRIKFNRLDDGVEYLLTRDRRIKKDVGVAYKSYFVYNKTKVVKVDSVFFGDRSDTERPDEVFNIDKNQYNGVLSRLSCEPLNKDIKLSYFRYTYFDTDKNVRRYRFQTENGKLNSFVAERTFKLGDTIIHLTKNKNVYQSSIFANDTVKLRYPLSDKDTLKYRSVYCGNSPGGSNNFFGSKDQIFMNFKFKNLIILGEQSVLSKMDLGLVPIGQPGADEKGYALTKVYVLSNNSVRSINRIMVPYFSNKTSSYSFVYNDDKKIICLVDMGYPVFFIFDENGNIKLKEANSESCLPAVLLAGRKFVVNLNNSVYMVYRDANTGRTKLIPAFF